MPGKIDRRVREGYGTLFEAVLKACGEAGLDEDTATSIAVRTVEIVQAGNMTPRQDDHHE
jgi:hypothetical protein